MNTVKYFEVRDRATNVSVCCVDMSGKGRSRADHGILAHAGYSPQVRCILYTELSGYRSNYEAYKWGGRTHISAHIYIHENWDDLKSGDLIDVQFVLRESKESKTSENTCENFV